MDLFSKKVNCIILIHSIEIFFYLKRISLNSTFHPVLFSWECHMFGVNSLRRDIIQHIFPLKIDIEIAQRWIFKSEVISWV